MDLSVAIVKEESRFPLPAVKFLEQFKGDTFSEASARGLRHPLGMYNLSIATVAKAFKETLDATEARKAKFLNNAQSKEEDEHLILSLDSLLDTVVEHFDDAKGIMCVFADREDQTAGRKMLNDFSSTIKEARNFSAKQANEIKHRQARVRLIRISNQQVFIPGYFIEGVSTDGAICPNPIIHDGGNTAFSIGRSLRTLVCSVYFLSNALPVLATPKKTVAAKIQPTGFGQLLPVFDRLLQLDKYVFYDEIDKCPAIVETANKISISTKSRSIYQPPPQGCRIELEYTGDGMSRTFKLPYGGKDIPVSSSAPFKKKKPYFEFRQNH